jgi:hypothetical protein
MAHVAMALATGPRASSSYKKEDEVGEGKGRRVTAGLQILACCPCVLWPVLAPPAPAKMKIM